MPGLFDLSEKDIPPEEIAEKAIQDRAVLQALLDGISPETKKTALRENSFRALMLLSEQHPELLLAHWSYFAGLLGSANGFTKYAAIHIIAALAPVEKQGRFEKAFGAFYSLLDDESVMVSSHVAGASGKIAKAKPALQARITERLLAIDQTHFDPSHQALIASYAIEAFEEYFGMSPDRAAIIAFVRRHLDCASPKTRKMAKAFLKKWETVV